MKSSFISSSAIQNAMRLTIRQSQNQMIKASQEATTGIYADIGVSLGGHAAKSVDFTREVSRIDAIVKSNSVVSQRLESSQVALSAMGKAGQEMLDQLIALRGNDDSSSVQLASQTATSALATLMSYGNTMVNGEYLFAGINTDVQPLTDKTSDFKTEINTRLTAYMAAQTPPVASKADLTGDQMTDFIQTKVEPMFTDDSQPAPFNWASWSSASNQNMTSRISNSEVIESSTNTNAEGMRYFALASVVTTALMGQGLPTGALNAVNDKAISYTRQAIDGLTDQQSQLGLSEERVTKANDALDAQKDIIQNKIVDLQGVDRYEASTLVNTLETQLETAYTIVAKIQQLSLVNYL